MYDVIIIGCGVVGAAAAYQLARYQASRHWCWRHSNDVANGTTKANSAIIHAGYDPEPGTLMARLNVEGNRMAGEICEKLDVPFAARGQLCAGLHDEAECQTLRNAFTTAGVANGVPGLRLLTGDEARAHGAEPQREQVQARLYAPSARHREPVGICPRHGRDGGAKTAWSCAWNSPVTAHWQDSTGGFRAADAARRVRGRKLCVQRRRGAGRSGARPAGRARLCHTPPAGANITCWTKARARRWAASSSSAPTKDGKGVLVAPTVHGNLIVGPNAEPVQDRRDLGTTGAGLAYVREKAAAQRAGPELPREHPQLRRACGPSAPRRLHPRRRARPPPAFSTWRASSLPALPAPRPSAPWRLELLRESGP